MISLFDPFTALPVDALQDLLRAPIDYPTTSRVKQYREQRGCATCSRSAQPRRRPLNLPCGERSYGAPRCMDPGTCPSFQRMGIAPREWGTSHYPDGFFDSCVSYGRHTPEIVVNDTMQAFASGAELGGDHVARLLSRRRDREEFCDGEGPYC